MSGLFYGDLQLRFWSKVKPAPYTECWEWTASRTSTGYGQFAIAGMPRKAHRVAYELMVTEIPDGLHLDHLCRNPLCVNPWHLDPVTNAVNTERGRLRTVLNAKPPKSHCPSGHEYAGDNLYFDSEGYRACRTCNRARCLNNYYRWQQPLNLGEPA